MKRVHLVPGAAKLDLRCGLRKLLLLAKLTVPENLDGKSALCGCGWRILMASI